LLHFRYMIGIAASNFKPVRVISPVWLVCCVWIALATAARSAEPIKIGAVLPFSGGVELYGRQAKLGLDLAAKDINAGGGILGRPVEIVYEDDKTDPAAAVEATQKLVARDAVLALVGPITSRNLDAMVPVVEGMKTPLLYATNYEGGKCGRYIFSFSTVPNQELAPLLPYMTSTFGKTYFLLGADRLWPHKMFEAAEPMIQKLGGRIVGKEFTTGKETDFAPLIARIAATKAKVLLFALKGDGLNFIPQADDLGLLKSTTIAFLGLSETDLGLFGGKAQNMFVVVPFVATSSLPSVKKFVARVKAGAGADATVSNYVLTHYNTLMATKAAIEKTGKVDKESLIDALEGLAIKSPTGPVTIGKDHHATMNMFLAKTKGRDLVTVRDLGQIKPEPRCN
jgi:branched-chain amino acid transport system substrate-binding protein/urea transport system substrate-binding protein